MLTSAGYSDSAGGVGTEAQRLIVGVDPAAALEVLGKTHQPSVGVAAGVGPLASWRRPNIAARKRVGNKPRTFRHYVLRGLLYCDCGTRMRARLSRPALPGRSGRG